MKGGQLLKRKTAIKWNLPDKKERERKRERRSICDGQIGREENQKEDCTKDQ